MASSDNCPPKTHTYPNYVPAVKNTQVRGIPTSLKIVTVTPLWPGVKVAGGVTEMYPPKSVGVLGSQDGIHSRMKKETNPQP